MASKTACVNKVDTSEQNKNIFLEHCTGPVAGVRAEVQRWSTASGNSQKVDGASLLEATEVFGSALRKAQDNPPFSSEIFLAIENLWESVRHVQITLTGDAEYGIARCTARKTTRPCKV
jgi:hypothetical protein